MAEERTTTEIGIDGMPAPLPTVPKESKKQMEERLRGELDYIKESQRHQYDEIRTFLQIHKTWYKTRQKGMVLPKQPIVILLRNWKDVEIYEGVRGTTFIVPPPPEHKGAVKVGEEKTKKPYKRTVHLSPSDLYTIHWGDDTVKGYIVMEDDAVPVGADIKVWSERLEYTLDAILINFEKFKQGMRDTTNDWIVQIIKYGIIGFIAWLVVKWLIFNDAPTPTEVGTITDTVIPEGVTVLN